MRTEASDEGNAQELLNKIRDLESRLAAEQKARSELAGGRSQFELQIRQLEDQLGMERKMSVTHQVTISSTCYARFFRRYFGAKISAQKLFVKC